MITPARPMNDGELRGVEFEARGEEVFLPPDPDGPSFIIIDVGRDNPGGK